MSRKNTGKTDFTAAAGLAAGFVLLCTAIVLDGDPQAFLNQRAALIVLGGTIAITLISFGFRDALHAAGAGLGVLSGRSEPLQGAAGRMVDIAVTSQKTGLRGVEKRLKEVRKDVFLLHALTLVVEGIKADELERLLAAELETLKKRWARSACILRRAAEVAPAMGLIGTLVGLVQMLAQLNDPGSIGPAMAVALITTLYGTILGNMVFAPLASRLEQNAQEQELRLIIYATGAASIGRQETPRRLQMAINAMLPPADQIRVYL